jgi:hypothetical protein
MMTIANDKLRKAIGSEIDKLVEVFDSLTPPKQEKLAQFMEGLADILDPKKILAESVYASDDEIKGTIVICLAPRPDGGLRVWSPTFPGLILSGPDPDTVMRDVYPTIRKIKDLR